MSDELVEALRCMSRSCRFGWELDDEEFTPMADLLDGWADRLEAARSGDPSAQAALADMLGMTEVRFYDEAGSVWRFPEGEGEKP